VPSQIKARTGLIHNYFLFIQKGSNMTRLLMLFMTLTLLTSQCLSIAAIGHGQNAKPLSGQGQPATIRSINGLPRPQRRRVSRRAGTFGRLIATEAQAEDRP